LPIYEYACPSCGASFEAYVKSWGEDVEACPRCGSPKVEKRVSSFAMKSASAAGGSCGCGRGGCGCHP
jgi:putative FmdB family regulatory protein